MAPRDGAPSTSDADALLLRRLRAREGIDQDAVERVVQRRAAHPTTQPLAASLVQAGVLDAAQLGELLRAGADSDAPTASPPTAAPTGDELDWAPDADLPSRLGGVELVREIARGGMGIVAEGRDPQLDRRVAVKLLRCERRSATQRARLAREATVLAGLSHPGLLRVHRFGEVNGPDGAPLQYIVMAYVEGPTLADALAAGLSQTRGLALLEQVAEAVGHAHAHGVVHRDLKPANVLLADDRTRAIVGDFGLALIEGDARMTATGAVLGTALYMAPEQVLGQRAAETPRTDVWALGVMLYELLAGRLPFRAATAPGVYQKILDCEPPSLRAGRGRGTPLEAICRRALARDPAERFADGRALAAELRRVREGRASTTRPASPLRRLRRRLRRRPAVWAVLTAALALCAVLGGVAWRRSVRFASLSALARRRHASGDLAGAQAACEAALTVRESPALRALAARCREAHARRRAAAAAAEHAARETRQLDALAARVHQLRALFYVADVDLRPRLDALAGELAGIAAAARRRDDRSPRRWTLLGIGWYHLGRRPAAEDALRRAVRLAEGDGWPRYWLARVLLERVLATRLVSRLVGDPPGAARWAREAQRLLEPAGGWSGAGEREREAAAAYRALAEDRPADAVATCRVALEHLGPDQPGCEVLWNLIAAAADPQTALQAWSRALAIRPHDSWALGARAATRLARGELDAAAADLTHALRIAPEDPFAWSSQGALDQLRGDPDAALAAFRKAVALGPELVIARYNLGQLLLRVGQPRAALEAQRQAARQAPRFVEAVVGEADALHALGRSGDAEAAYQRAIALDPRRATTYLNRGRTRYAAGRPEAALADWQQALALDPRLAAAWLNRARYRLERRRDPVGALADLERALAIDPRLADAYQTRGLIHHGAGRLAEARADYDRAIRHDPRNAAAYCNRGALRRATGDAAGGLVDLDRAIASDPRFALARYNRGNAHAAAGRHAAALTDYAKAIELDPRDARFALHRARVLVLVGRVEQARAELTAARGRVPLAQQGLIDAALRRLPR